MSKTTGAVTCTPYLELRLRGAAWCQRRGEMSHFLRVKGLPSGWLPRSSLAVLLLDQRTEHAGLAFAFEPVALALDVDRHRVV